MRKISLLSNRQGWAILLVLILVGVLPLLAASVFYYTNMRIRQVDSYRDVTYANRLALSSLEAVTEFLRFSSDGQMLGELERVYYMQDYSFVLEDDWQNLDLMTRDTQTIGYVDIIIALATEMEQAPSDAIVVTATAKVNDTVKERKVVLTGSSSTGPTTIEQDLIFDNGTGQLKPGEPLPGGEIIQIANPPANNIKTDLQVTYYDWMEYSVVILQTEQEDEKITLADEQYLMIRTKYLIFKQEVDISQFNEMKGLLIEAEVIVFEQPVKIRITPAQTLGALLINLPSSPEGLGVTVPGKDGRYARVYFQQGVTVSWHGGGANEPEMSTLAPGGYYIRKKDFDQPLHVGYFMHENTEVYLNNNDVFFPMADGSEHISPPPIETADDAFDFYYAS